MRGYRYRPRREISPEEKAANAARKARRLAATMTCQCCAKKYLANLGSMAHHGYQRPGWGWQTASCVGAKRLPFEVSRDTLGELLDLLKLWIEKHTIAAKEIEAEARQVTYRYTEYSGYAKRENKTLLFTRATFDQVVAENPKVFRNLWNATFDHFKADDVEYNKRQIEGLKADLVEHTKRFDSWKQTHEWDADQKEWRKL
jgi:hypothetical protein